MHKELNNNARYVEEKQNNKDRKEEGQNITYNDGNVDDQGRASKVCIGESPNTNINNMKHNMIRKKDKNCNQMESNNKWVQNKHVNMSSNQEYPHDRLNHYEVNQLEDINKRKCHMQDESSRKRENIPIEFQHQTQDEVKNTEVRS